MLAAQVAVGRAGARLDPGSGDARTRIEPSGCPRPSGRFFVFLDGEYLGQQLVRHFRLPEERDYNDLGTYASAWSGWRSRSASHALLQYPPSGWRTR